MNLAILEKQLQRLSDTLSEFDDALIDAQMNSVPGPNITDIRRRRLLAEIDNEPFKHKWKCLRYWGKD